MNVFVIGTALETAMALDRKRLNKQIVECKQILDAMEGVGAWKNHPCVLQYKMHSQWLKSYMRCLICYRRGWVEDAEYHSNQAQYIKPFFHTEGYFQQMKRRLYTKSPNLYEEWAYLGTSEVNWYCVDGEWRYYVKGKRVNYSF